jgi:hypothetical protein
MARDVERLDPLYEYLKQVHKQNFPDWRFMQFMKNFMDWYGADPFYMEDDKVYDRVEKFLQHLKVQNSFVKKI